MSDTVQKALTTFVLLLTRWTHVGGSCLKFSSDPALHATAVVDGVCYYGFNNNVQYATAEALCLSESTQLPNFQVEATQESVYAALGSQYGQHWLGLKKVSGVWKWWDVVTGTGTDMTSPRWEGGSSGECAYSHTSNMGGKWKAVPLTAWYRVVCQEAGVPAPRATTIVPATTTDVTGGSCLKFSSDPALHATAVVDGVCYYGFNNNAQYATAEALCLSEWTQLPDFQVEATQESVYAALGSQYGQHWLGLKKVSGVWKWWDVVTGTGTDMTSPRWEGGSSGECAYSHTSNMGGKWKAVPLTAWYRVVCQETGVPATTVESSIATTIPPPTTTVLATTTTVSATTPGVTVGSCLKFSSDPALHATAVVDGVCYYGFNNNVQYASAEALCLSEWTQLPDFQIEDTQESVYAALGSQYGQHWLGLKKVSGVWKWWDVVTGTGTDMTSPRWEGGSSGECAYSHTSNMGGKWKAVPLTAWYRVVCQETGVPATTVESSTTTVPVTTTTVPVTTTTEPVTTTTVPATTSDTATTTSDFQVSCPRSFDGGVVTEMFDKCFTLTGVEETSIMTVTSVTRCGQTCVAKPDCCSFVFDVTTKVCRHFRPTWLGTDVTPTSFEKCYTAV